MWYSMPHGDEDDPLFTSGTTRSIDVLVAARRRVWTDCVKRRTVPNTRCRQKMSFSWSSGASLSSLFASSRLPGFLSDASHCCACSRNLGSERRLSSTSASISSNSSTRLSSCARQAENCPHGVLDWKYACSIPSCIDASSAVWGLPLYVSRRGFSRIPCQ